MWLPAATDKEGIECPPGFERQAIARQTGDAMDVAEGLRQSEERYRFLFENNPQPMWAFEWENHSMLAANVRMN